MKLEIGTATSTGYYYSLYDDEGKMVKYEEVPVDKLSNDPNRGFPEFARAVTRTIKSLDEHITTLFPFKGRLDPPDQRSLLIQDIVDIHNRLVASEKGIPMIS